MDKRNEIIEKLHKLQIKLHKDMIEDYASNNGFTINNLEISIEGDEINMKFKLKAHTN